MPQILEAKGGELTIFKALGIAGLKIFSEQALSRVAFIGNGTLRSGLIKGVSAVLLTTVTPKSGFMGNLARMEGTALMIDAGEDIVGALLGRNNASANAPVNTSERGTSNQGAGVMNLV